MQAPPSATGTQACGKDAAPGGEQLLLALLKLPSAISSSLQVSVKLSAYTKRRYETVTSASDDSENNVVSDTLATHRCRMALLPVSGAVLAKVLIKS